MEYAENAEMAELLEELREEEERALLALKSQMKHGKSVDGRQVASMDSHALFPPNCVQPFCWQRGSGALLELLPFFGTHFTHGRVSVAVHTMPCEAQNVSPALPLSVQPLAGQTPAEEEDENEEREEDLEEEDPHANLMTLCVSGRNVTGSQYWVVVSDDADDAYFQE